MAGVSTTAAVLSMLTAYRTHRRLRPRIKIELSRFTSHLADTDGAQTYYLCLPMRVVNDGASKVSVEEIRLHFRYYTQGAATSWGTKPSDTGGCTYTPAEPLVVDPMDGTKFEPVFEFRAINPHNLRVRSGHYRLALSNGREIYGRLERWDVSSARSKFNYRDR